MRALFFPPLILISSLHFIACSQRLDEMDDKISDLQNRARVLEAKTGAPVGTDRELLEGQKLADVRSQLSSLRNEMTVLAGKIEALEYESKRLSNRTESISDDLNSQIRNLQKKANIEASPVSSNAEDGVFEAALKAHQDGKYEEAEKGFDEFLKKNPKHSLAPRAIFWIADGYMNQKMYKKAIAKFQDLIDRFPKSDKRCEAMTKQIQAFKELKMDKEAKVFTQVKDAECK